MSRSDSAHHRPPRSGQTMLELVAATTIIAIALVPALRLTRDGLANLDRIERYEQAATLCASLLEEEMARTAAYWDLSARTGDFRALGFRDLQFSVFKSDRNADGGVPGALAVIRVTVWYDADGGGDLDSDETRTEFTTKMARVLSYEYEATLH